VGNLKEFKEYVDGEWQRFKSGEIVYLQDDLIRLVDALAGKLNFSKRYRSSKLKPRRQVSLVS
jgi:hypothetical protein